MIKYCIYYFGFVNFNYLCKQEGIMGKLQHTIYIIMCSFLLLFSSNMDAKGVSQQFYEQMSRLSSNELNERANHYAHEGSSPDSAFLCYSLVTRRFHSNMSKQELSDVARAWHGLWYIYFFYHYDFARAMECLRKYQTFAQEAQLPDSEARPWLMKGVMNETVADETGDASLVREAIHCYDEALRAAAKVNNYRVTVDAFSDLLLIMSDHPDAKLLSEAYPRFVKVAGASPEREGSYDYALLLYQNVRARADRNFPAALRACAKLMALGKKNTRDLRYLLSAYSIRSKTYAQMGDYLRAIADMHYLEDQAKATQFIDFLMPVYKDLQSYYKKTGDKAKADYYKQQHIELKDSLLSYHQMASVKEMSFLGEKEDMEAQMAAVERHNFLWKLFLGISLLIVTVIAIAFVLLRRKNRELEDSNKMLYEKNVALLKAEEERKRRLLEQQKEDNKNNQKADKVDHKEVKYKSSSLDEAAKLSLQQMLRDVMDTTDEYLSPDFSIACLAELVGSTTKVVSQVINECFGNNFNAFVNEYRIRRACQMMDGKEHLNLTVQAIGNEVGFKSHTTFVTAFKRFTGLTPSNYLALAKTNAPVNS